MPPNVNGNSYITRVLDQPINWCRRVGLISHSTQRPVVNQQHIECTNGCLSTFLSRKRQSQSDNRRTSIGSSRELLAEHVDEFHSSKKKPGRIQRLTSLFARAPSYKIESSTLSPIWRNSEPEESYAIPSSAPDFVITDDISKALVSRAKRRYEMMTRQSMPTIRGICFAAADEFANFLVSQSIDAKVVRIMPKAGGTDHYFVVIKMEGGEPRIVDGTWTQFYKRGPQPVHCLQGTLEEIRQSLCQVELTMNLPAMYKEGLKVVEQWDSYSAFAQE